MKIQIMLLLATFGILGKAYFVPNVQCACQQIVTQDICDNTQNCLWVTTTAEGSTGYCGQKPCSAITDQQTCQAEMLRCYYQEATQGSTQVCYPLSKCEDIVLAANTTCQQTNPWCVPSQTQKPQCVNSGQQCSTLSQTQCQAGLASQSVLSAEGMCYWNGNSCKVVTNCGDIINQDQCGANALKNACTWGTLQCIPLLCSMIQNQEQCTFVNTSPLLSNTTIQPCQWNGTICQNANIDQLDSQTCLSNTNSHFRWIGNQNNGICAQCNSHKYVYRNQCECKQLLQQSECINSPNCHWISTQTPPCQPSTCSSILNQQTCAQIQGCYWNISVKPNVCANYTNCNAIVGANTQACITQSIYCPGSNGTTCQPQNSVSTCSTLNKQPNVCYNSIGKVGFCTYDIANSACVDVTSCSQLETRQLCNQFNNSCIWVTGASSQCQNKTCSNHLTQASCTYVQNGINTNVINICSWNPNTQKCYAFDNSFDYDINSCFSSTGRTHHWSESSNASKGLCLPCHYSSVLNVKSKCTCSELINYTDCALSSPKCFWDSATQSCQQQNCAQLTSQGQCVMSKYCYWNSNTGCQSIGSPSTTCATLQGNTQQECLSQSILCGGVKNGKCSTSPNSCGDFTQYYQCFGSVGTDGVCQWNLNTKTCSGISNCNMITTQAQCQLIINTCYWNTESLTCMPYTCSTLQAQTGSCNYYLSTPNQNYEVKLCFLNAGQCTETSNLQSLTSSNCYASSAGTARYNDETCQFCYSQLISVLFIILIYMF